MDRNLKEFAADMLADDAHAAGISRLLDELFQMETTLKQKTDCGVSMEEANKTGIIRQAIESSRMIVDKIWNSSSIWDGSMPWSRQRHP